VAHATISPPKYLYGTRTLWHEFVKGMKTMKKKKKKTAGLRTLQRM
jgi:hypothetical protein